MVRKLIRWAVALMTFGVTVLAFAQDISFSATVDKTSVKLGEPITLTVTLSGDISGLQLPPLEFPEGFAVAGRSQSTNFSLRVGAIERSTSLTYVLIPQKAGTFQLGPFYVEHHGQTLPTQPIPITVEKPAVPPSLPPQGERFIL